MKLADHVNHLRELIEASFDKQFARLGFGKVKQMSDEQVTNLPDEVKEKRARFVQMLESHIGETGSYDSAREKLLDELTFTLFNRLAAIKVMEAANLFPPILTKQIEHGDRSFGHKVWLEMNPDMRDEELEGIHRYLESAFDDLAQTLPLYSKAYPYAMLPDTVSLNDIIDAFNAVEKDDQINSAYEDGIWHSDDVLGWMYESYNNKKKQTHKESKAKTEFNKVSLQSQVYTPRWVVQFLVENSLGKMYLEMYPHSEIKQRYKIANAPTKQERKPKPLHEVRTIDPACGSGNFLLYAFDFYYELYLDQIENYGADYEEKDIPKLIIENNLHGIDLDDRAVQLAQLGLFIKAKKKRRTIGKLNFRVVSSDFYLPAYAEVKHIFEQGSLVSVKQQEFIEKVWADLMQAYKFGSLIHIDKELKEQLAQVKDLALGEAFDSTQKLKKKIVEGDLFAAADYAEHKAFAENFFENLFAAVELYAKTDSNTFLSDKTRDALVFLELLTNEYDVATANPPYTDSSDFGPELKIFIEDNYKKPHKCHTNLYAAFIKRCYELTIKDGKIAVIHPDTFMFIKTYDGVRSFILDSMHINVFVHYPQTGGVFGIGLVYPAFYVLEKNTSNEDSLFLKMENDKGGRRAEVESFNQRLDEAIKNISPPRYYKINQKDFCLIESNPFVYWISSEFRAKFKGKTLANFFDISFGLKSADNLRYFKFFWEVSESSSRIYNGLYKAGPSNRWFGNHWLSIDYDYQKPFIKNEKSSGFSGEKYYKKQGIICPSISAQATTFRINEDSIFSNADLGIYPKPKNQNMDIYSVLGFLNSKLVQHINKMLNPTVNTMPNDLKRIPFIKPPAFMEKELSSLSLCCTEIKKHLCEFQIINPNFKVHPFLYWNCQDLNVKKYFNYENHLIAHISIIEAVIEEIILDLYELNDNDREVIIEKEGKSIGCLPVVDEARKAYLLESSATDKFPLNPICDFIEALPTIIFTVEEREIIENNFVSLYQNNNSLEEFCIRHQINPINIWYWFKQSKIIPKQRMKTLAMEFLIHMIREILMEDEDGIIPLVKNAGEKVLLDRIEEKFIEKGFSTAQYSSFDSILGRPLCEFINKQFFEQLTEHLNLFQYLPKTPFIWHLTSGPEQGFDCYTIIYKWDRDNLMRLRSVYIENRERALINRQSDIADKETADAQNEKDRIFKQLKEIEVFKKKIDELLAEGYDPVLDDGVGKNIAPLQQKKMLAYDVLNAGQLKKYLNADW
ncbi:restriction endonuclease [Vibrio parahaemolyticus]|uniref:Eco57I restriction-modification methylase domain-containing protein n=1 Tax=Vibrio parahaemolyticus TaxID=670 RepID=UPI0011208597|nr:N-6 DNA methylase [Vibrio parahaemolyticus]TOC13215.1 restriction endonuclease [Vibrio parahaemolyticus]TOQ98381.1 restriction endonuclease [Vibrio parahaemolyticus]